MHTNNISALTPAPNCMYIMVTNNLNSNNMYKNAMQDQWIA